MTIQYPVNEVVLCSLYGKLKKYIIFEVQRASFNDMLAGGKFRPEGSNATDVGDDDAHTDDGYCGEEARFYHQI